METTPEIAHPWQPLVLALPTIYAVTIPASYLLQHHADLPGRWTVTGSKRRPRATAHLTEHGAIKTINVVRDTQGIHVSPALPRPPYEYLADLSDEDRSRRRRSELCDRIAKTRTIERLEQMREQLDHDDKLLVHDANAVFVAISHRIMSLREARTK